MSDGFYVDVEELYNVFEGLQSQSEKIIASIETAKSSYNSVITSNSMYGDVGQAIAGEINSSHNMLLMQLKDLLYSLQSDFSKEVESFQSATGEKSSTAIISHSYLKSTGEYFDTLKGEIDQIRKTINSATDSVSDLVSVTSDAKNYEYFGGNLSNAKDVVTNTIEKVSAWDSQGTALTTETSLQNLQELLGQLHQTDGLDYSDPIISQVVNNLSPIADKVKEIDDQIDESVQKAKLEAQKAKELEDKERDRIEKDWRLHHPIQATLRDWRKGLSDGLDSMTNWMKDDPNWKWLKGFGDAAFGAVGDAVFGVAEFGVDLLQYSTEGVILGYNSLMGNETPQWMKDDLQGGIETFGNVILNTLGNAFGLVTMIPEVNNLINDLDDSTRDGSIMGAILHDVRHAKDLMQQPIRDKIRKAGSLSGYESGHAAGEIVSEIVSWIGPAKLFKMAGGSKLVSRLAQAPKIQKGISYFRKARTALSNGYLGKLARESYGATKDFFTSRLGNLWDDFSRKKFAFAGLDKFHYGDDIGKHTARLYQSTSEGAEYQRISRGLYSEAGEQSGRKVSREFSKETSEQLAKHSDDMARGLEETGKGKEAVEELLDGEGVFKNAELEERYQEYVVRNTNRGRRISDRLTWKQDSDFFTQNSPIARGNRFNETVQERKTYPHHEVNLENGKRLDSYDPTAGEIISRKATDLDRIQEETFRGYLQELQDKYSVGETIRSNKYPEIDGLKLDGKHILEIPDSNKHLPDIEKFKEIAKEYGVELRFTKE